MNERFIHLANTYVLKMADDDVGQDGNKSSKKIAKKKYYPFGTPSHLHHPFSEFAHLAVSTRSFALDLATATDIKPEVIEEKEPPRRRKIIIPKKKNSTSGTGSVEGSEENEETSLESDLQPCTKLACQIILRSLSDMEVRNQMERIDLEDEYERHMQDLKFAEQDVYQTEGKLEKLTDFGNQLEISCNQLLSKVDTLEKRKEALAAEKNDISAKVKSNFSFKLYNRDVIHLDVNS